MEVFFGGSGYDRVVVGHEDNMMNEDVIFFTCFREGLKEYPDGLALVEAERPVVDFADQVIG